MATDKSAEWLRVRSSWIHENPPSHEGHYVCGICGMSVHKDGMELDHILPRSGTPQSFADYTNLQPTHSRCNRLKGSRRLKPVISRAEYDMRKLLDL